MSTEPSPRTNGNAWAESISKVLVATVERIRNERFLLGIALFVVAVTAAVVVLVFRPDDWVAAPVTALVVLVASFLFLRSLLPAKKKHVDDVFVRVTTISDVRQMLSEMNEQEIERFRKRHGLPPFAEDRDTLKKKINDAFEYLPVAQLRSLEQKLDLRIIILFLASVVLATWLLVLWIMGRPTEQESIIRKFYGGINVGLTGNPEGWSDAWNACTEDKQKGFDIVAHKLFGSTSNGPDNLETLYEDSDEHRIRNISLDKRASSTEEHYLVVYEVNERVPFNDANMDISFQTSISVSKYFDRYPDANALVDEVMETLKQYFEMKSSAEDLKDMTPEELEQHIRAELLSESTTMQSLTKGTALRILGIVYRLKKKDYGHAAFTTGIYRHFQATYITKIVLRKVDGRWLIDSFKAQAEHFKPVQAQ